MDSNEEMRITIEVLKEKIKRLERENQKLLRRGK